MKFFKVLRVNEKATRQHPAQWGVIGNKYKIKVKPLQRGTHLGWFEEHNRRWGFGKGE